MSAKCKYFIKAILQKGRRRLIGGATVLNWSFLVSNIVTEIICPLARVGWPLWDETTAVRMEWPLWNLPFINLSLFGKLSSQRLVTLICQLISLSSFNSIPLKASSICSLLAVFNLSSLTLISVVVHAIFKPKKIINNSSGQLGHVMVVTKLLDGRNNTVGHLI